MPPSNILSTQYPKTRFEIVTNSLFTYTYDQIGNRLGVLGLNGDVVTWTYDRTYQLTNGTAAAPTATTRPIVMIRSATGR